MADPANLSFSIYYKNACPFYSSSNQGEKFCYASGSNYNPNEGTPWDTYSIYNNKTTQTDDATGYSNLYATWQLLPTDSDYALGYQDFGRRQMWYYVGPTYFVNSSPGGGALHAPVTDVSASTTASTTAYNTLYGFLKPFSGDSSGYTTCSATDKNTCSYIVNAGLTPTAGTLSSAYTYFNTTSTTPISAMCQKNFIIYVTDGLPSTDPSGNTGTSDTLIGWQSVATATAAGTTCYNASKQQCGTAATCASTDVCYDVNGYPVYSNASSVLAYLAKLRAGVTISSISSTPFSIATYVLGVGMTDGDKAKLDIMAAEAGTLNSNGHTYYANNANDLVTALQAIFYDIVRKASAGSSVSVLSEKTQAGMNMMQGVFYPFKRFAYTTSSGTTGNIYIDWVGFLYNYWFYAGTSYSNMREDTDHSSYTNAYHLNLYKDYGLVFSSTYTDSNSYDPDFIISRYQDTSTTANVGDGTLDTLVDTNKTLDDITPVWESGSMLRDTKASARTIYTVGSDGNLITFNSTNLTASPTYSSYLGTTASFFPSCLGSFSTTMLGSLVDYTRGKDCSGCRSRSWYSNISDGVYNGENTWKLGDIVYSTPKLVSDYKYCYVSNAFNSTSCATDSDCSSGGACLVKEGAVFVGANDGMLHAFKTGVLTTSGLSGNDVAGLSVNPATNLSSLGSELWGFIPKNALPYLRCLPDPSYAHIYTVDLSPYISTMTATTFTNSSKTAVQSQATKTVVIGGMRLGGGTCNSTTSGSTTTYTCTAPPDTCTSSFTDTDLACYNNNLSGAKTGTGGTCSSSTLSCTGLSSYYALDVSDVENPKYLWEFSHPNLGYSYSGPAVITRTANGANQYYVMFLSGPTETTYGSSNQNVYAFIMTLDQTTLAITNVTVKSLSAYTYGFGGKLFNTGLDYDSDGYTDDVIFGVSYAASADYTSGGTPPVTNWKGAIVRVYTGTDSAKNEVSPANWVFDTNMYNPATNPVHGNQPITAKIQTSKCFDKWSIFGGTGRYFYKADNEPSTSQDVIFAAPFPCDATNSCNGTTVSTTSGGTFGSTLCGNIANGTSGWTGWQIPLESYTDAKTVTSSDTDPLSYYKERLITDPTVSSANVAYFTTMEAYYDVCRYGGHNRVWGVNCATGGTISDTTCSSYQVSSTAAAGTLYLQTSTGAIISVGPTSFTQQSNKATAWYAGLPPENAPPYVAPLNPSTAGTVLHWIEK